MDCSTNLVAISSSLFSGLSVMPMDSRFQNCSISLLAGISSGELCTAAREMQVKEVGEI
uniref:Uncharacterized protein n=1 Tax=Meloidogyne incognita TaxID=6306 RepID=A0A914LCZ8_MELIC